MYVTLYLPQLGTCAIFFQAPGYEELITALYWKGDPYIMSDAVFGVKSSLIVVGFIYPLFFKKKIHAS